MDGVVDDSWKGNFIGAFEFAADIRNKYSAVFE